MAESLAVTQMSLQSGLQLPLQQVGLGGYASTHSCSALHWGYSTLGTEGKGAEAGGHPAPTPCCLMAAVDRDRFYMAPASAVWERAELVTKEQAQQIASQRARWRNR